MGKKNNIENYLLSNLGKFLIKNNTIFFEIYLKIVKQEYGKKFYR